MKRAEFMTLHRDEGDYLVGFYFTPGYQGRMYEDRHGNPPIPPDPPEVEIVSVTLDGIPVNPSTELAAEIEDAAMEHGISSCDCERR